MACLRCGDLIANGAQFCNRCLPQQPDFFSPWRQREIREGIVRESTQWELASIVVCFVFAGIHFLGGVIALLIHNRLEGAYTLSDLLLDMKSIYPIPIPVLFPTVYYCFFYMTILLVCGFYCTGKRRRLMTKPDFPLLSVYSMRDLILTLLLSAMCCLGISLLAAGCVFFSLNPHKSIHGVDARGRVSKSSRRVVRINGTEIYFERYKHKWGRNRQ